MTSTALAGSLPPADVPGDLPFNGRPLREDAASSVTGAASPRLVPLAFRIEKRFTAFNRALGFRGFWP